MRATLKRNIINREIYVKMPETDMVFFQLFADKMGWAIENKQNIWDEYIKNSPKNIPLSEEEIMEDVRAVRYEKAQNNY